MDIKNKKEVEKYSTKDWHSSCAKCGMPKYECYCFILIDLEKESLRRSMNSNCPTSWGTRSFWKNSSNNNCSINQPKGDIR